MLESPCIVFSDAHLGASPPDVEESLLVLLRRARTEARAVVINGDLFEFWFEWARVMPRGTARVLSALADLHDDGGRVGWMAGNHDCWGGDILLVDVGVTYVVGPWRGEIGGWQTMIEHGDGLRERGDGPYRLMRAVFRNRLVVGAFKLLPPDLAVRLALIFSHTSRNKRPADGGAALRAVALSRLAGDPGLDLYLFGHTHTQLLEQAPDGGVLANPGAWLDEPSYLRISDGTIELRRLRGGTHDGADELIGALRRRARGT